MAAVALAWHKSAIAPQVSPEPTTNEAQVFVSRPKLPEYPEFASASNKRRWLVDQLRAMGVPNKVLARIALADLDKQWSAHAAEVSKRCYGDHDTLVALQLENDMSLDAEMRVALGSEGFEQWDRENMLREADQGKDRLSDSEANATYELWKKLRQRGLELKQAMLKGEMDNADANDAYDTAVAEFKRQMSALLGEARYAKSQGLDDGTAAAGLRQDFARANPTDSQFQELLKAQQQWNNQRAALDTHFQDDPSSATYADQIEALNAARDQEYRRVLGTNTFNTLEKEQDPGYSQMKRYQSLWGLDDNEIDSVYGAIKYYQKNAADYQARARASEAQGQSVDWDAVNKNLQQFTDQISLALQNYLGRDRLDKMLRNGVFQLSPPELIGHSPSSK
jgi:hypothetical protein